MTDKTLFITKAPGIMHQLMADFGLNDIQAAAILGNIGTECAGFHQLHENGQREGMGGYGWAQWTGHRREKFFDYCKAHGFFEGGIEGGQWKGDKPNYGYLKSELQSSENGVISALRKINTLEEAVKVFEKDYEDPGVPNLDSREAWARVALDAFRNSKA